MKKNSASKPAHSLPPENPAQIGAWVNCDKLAFIDDPVTESARVRELIEARFGMPHETPGLLLMLNGWPGRRGDTRLPTVEWPTKFEQKHIQDAYVAFIQDRISEGYKIGIYTSRPRALSLTESALGGFNSTSNDEIFENRYGWMIRAGVSYLALDASGAQHDELIDSLNEWINNNYPENLEFRILREPGMSGELLSTGIRSFNKYRPELAEAAKARKLSHQGFVICNGPSNHPLPKRRGPTLDQMNQLLDIPIHILVGNVDSDIRTLILNHCLDNFPGLGHPNS